MVIDRHAAPDLPPELLGCLEACRRCRDIVGRVEGSIEQGSSSVYSRIGPHLRHCLDHFTCLFAALDRGDVVDYDARERDASVEHDPEVFLAALERVIDRLRGLADADLRQALRVRQTAAPGGLDAVSTTNLGRELVFLSGHTIHHLEIVRLLCVTDGIRVPDDWTTAYSTEAFRSRLEPETK